MPAGLAPCGVGGVILAHLEAARVDALHAEVAVGAAAEAAVEPVAVDDAVRVGRGGVGL